MTFVRVAAPTGSAAYNIKFHATTIHRLINWFTPPYFQVLKEGFAQLDKFQKYLEATELLVLDEISMVGRQMMGRIDSRCHQAKPGARNPKGHSVGGISLVCVGDPAQIQAIGDQQIYDTGPHPLTAKNAMAQAVWLSNTGREIYSEFDKVIVLQTTHRLAYVENPETPEDQAYNERADRFLSLLHRMRDLTLTVDDYFWLCDLKRSKKTLSERNAFKTAPVLMDFRRTTATNPEANCEYHNRMLRRSLARENKQPVVAIEAVHAGISHAQGMKLDETAFNGLVARVEVSEEARMLIIHNIDVENGLMNGTQGTLKAIVFAPGTHPNHDNVALRMPACFLLEVPEFTGAPFFPEKERRKWVPIFPRPREDESNRGVSRTQFHIVLGWALTPAPTLSLTLTLARRLTPTLAGARPDILGSFN